VQPVIKDVMMSAPISIFSGSDVGGHWRLEASPLKSIAGIGHGWLRPTRQPWSSRTVGAVDRTRDRVFDDLVGRWPSVHRRYGQRRFRSCHQAELFGRIVRVHHRGPRLA
jgi:hypothetical protein